MKREELRIGNIFDYENTAHVVMELHSDKILSRWIHSDSDGYYHSYDLASGMPLTEEWLLKFGFLGYKKQYSLNVGGELNFYWLNGDVVLWVVGNGLTLDSVFRHKGSHNPSHVIEYVHQLQNLYFALTGTELTIKP